MENDIAGADFGTVYSKYMVQRYISMESNYLSLIQEHQDALENMTNEMHYRYLMKILPKRHNPYIPYISKGKKKKK